MPIDPQEDPPIKPGQPVEPPQESPPGSPRPEVPPPMQDPGEPDGLGRQFGALQARSRGADVSLVEDQVQHVQHRSEPVGDLPDRGVPVDLLERAVGPPAQRVQDRIIGGPPTPRGGRSCLDTKEAVVRLPAGLTAIETIIAG